MSVNNISSDEVNVQTTKQRDAQNINTKETIQVFFLIVRALKCQHDSIQILYVITLRKRMLLRYLEVWGIIKQSSCLQFGTRGMPRSDNTNTDSAETNSIHRPKRYIEMKEFEIRRVCTSTADGLK